jgi:hypothetical protein
MLKIIIVLLFGISIVSANELDVNKQLKKVVKTKQEQLFRKQKKNRRAQKEIAVLTKTIDKINGIKTNEKQTIKKILYFNPLDGSRKIEKYGSSSKLPFAKYVNSTLLIESCKPQTGKKRTVCGRWLKVPEGKTIVFSIWVKAENVTGTQIKFGLMISNGKGKYKWPAANVGAGSFDWYKVSFSTVIPFGAKRCLLMYGLEKGIGKVYFKDLKMEVID